ncbi:hypothetical protein GCM10027160_49870 [Streptomyces calidiresistens]
MGRGRFPAPAPAPAPVPVPDPGGRTPLLDIERYPAAVPTNPGSPGIERTHAYRDRE